MSQALLNGGFLVLKNQLENVMTVRSKRPPVPMPTEWQSSPSGSSSPSTPLSESSYLLTFHGFLYFLERVISSLLKLGLILSSNKKVLNQSMKRLSIGLLQA